MSVSSHLSTSWSPRMPSFWWNEFAQTLITLKAKAAYEEKLASKDLIDMQESTKKLNEHHHRLEQLVSTRSQLEANREMNKLGVLTETEKVQKDRCESFIIQFDSGVVIQVQLCTGIQFVTCLVSVLHARHTSTMDSRAGLTDHALQLVWWCQ
jgi:hypothetical protein